MNNLLCRQGLPGEVEFCVLQHLLCASHDQCYFLKHVIFVVEQIVHSKRTHGGGLLVYLVDWFLESRW